MCTLIVTAWTTALQVENEDLIFTLETLVERFEQDMAPYAVGLTQHLAAAFWRMQVGLCSLLSVRRPTFACIGRPALALVSAMTWKGHASVYG